MVHIIFSLYSFIVCYLPSLLPSFLPPFLPSFVRLLSIFLLIFVSLYISISIYLSLSLYLSICFLLSFFLSLFLFLFFLICFFSLSLSLYVSLCSVPSCPVPSDCSVLCYLPVSLPLSMSVLHVDILRLSLTLQAQCFTCQPPSAQLASHRSPCQLFFLKQALRRIFVLLSEKSMPSQCPTRICVCIYIYIERERYLHM